MAVLVMIGAGFDGHSTAGCGAIELSMQLRVVLVQNVCRGEMVVAQASSDEQDIPLDLNNCSLFTIYCTKNDFRCHVAQIEGKFGKVRKCQQSHFPQFCQVRRSQFVASLFDKSKQPWTFHFLYFLFLSLRNFNSSTLQLIHFY